ncbi:MAG: DUF5318 family protein [Actinomycetes bacterium]
MAAPRHHSHRASRIRGERPSEPRHEPLPPAEPVSDPARPRSVVDFALTRRGVLERISAGDTFARGEHQDADPYLLRAAKHHGEPTERPCPLCHKVKLVHVTYVFGDELGPYSGRVKNSAELPVMAYEHGQFRVYVVEVCSGCSWNHLTMSYVLGDGVPRRPPRKPADLLD